MRESEERLKLAQQIGNIGSWEINLVNREGTCSDEMNAIFEGIFNPLLDAYLNTVHPEDCENVKQAIENTIKKGIPSDLDHRIILSGGKIKYLQTRSRVINDPSGRPLRFVSVVQDITQRKQYESELTAARIKAEESNKLKTSFLQNMSHEIRTPMNGILGFTQLLLEPGITKDEMNFYVQTISNSCNNLLNIINDIVEISKIETGIIQIYRSVFNLNNLMDELFNFFKYEAEQKNIGLKYTKEMSEDLAFIYSDEQKLRQILTNLIKNSIKFTHTGDITYNYSFTGKNIVFTIEDTGIGIDKKFHDIIFERFRQADNGNTKLYGGTGLGLAISKSLVEILGGKIWVESKPGSGSKFYFTIPNEPVDNSIIYNGKEKKKNEIPDFSSKTIILAEDDESNYYFIQSILSKTGARVIHALNGRQAVELINSHPQANIILMDIKMPVMDGLEATKEIRKMGVTTPIIAVTAYALKEEKMMSIEAGCNDYISKPLRINDFFQKIKKHLSNGKE